MEIVIANYQTLKSGRGHIINLETPVIIKDANGKPVIDPATKAPKMKMQTVFVNGLVIRKDVPDNAPGLDYLKNGVREKHEKLLSLFGGDLTPGNVADIPVTELDSGALRLDL